MMRRRVQRWNLVQQSDLRNSGNLGKNVDDESPPTSFNWPPTPVIPTTCPRGRLMGQVCPPARSNPMGNLIDEMRRTKKWESLRINGKTTWSPRTR